MKTKSFFALIAAALLSAAACNKLVAPEVSIEGPALANGNVSAPAAGAAYALTVQANVAWEFEASEDWVHMTPALDPVPEGHATTVGATLTIDPSAVIDPRTATVTLKAVEPYVANVTFTVSQEAYIPDPVVKFLDEKGMAAEPAFSFEKAASTVQASIYSNVSWTATSNADWCSVTPASVEVIRWAETTTPIAISCTENKTGKTRKAIVSVESAGASIQIAISQDGGAPTFQYTVTDITSDGAVVNVVPSDKNVTYLVCVEPKEILDYYSGLELIQAEIDNTEEFVQGMYGISFAYYASIMGYKGDQSDDWRSYLDPDTDYIAFAYAIKIDGDTYELLTEKLQYAEFATLSSSSSSWFTVDDIKGIKKENYVGDWYMFATDFYAESEDEMYVYWPVTVKDAGESDDCEWLDFEQFIPLTGASDVRMEWYSGFVYFDPAVSNFSYSYAGYNFSLYTLSSSTKKISQKDWMVAGYHKGNGTESDPTCVPFVCYPDQSMTTADGVYVACSAGAMFGAYNLYMIPATESSAILKNAVVEESNGVFKIKNATSLDENAQTILRKMSGSSVKSLVNVKEPKKATLGSIRKNFVELR